MEEILERLRRAAQSGSIDALYAVIQDDADILQRVDHMEFVDTPLNIAAAAGHTDFAMEMMNLKPSFARKLNSVGFSPIHLALQSEQTELVVDLLSIDKDLVRVKGREGYTPLHVVARDGNVPLLSQFLEQCPDCIWDLTIRKETALHITVQNDRLEAFKAMMQFIQRGTKYDYQHNIMKLRILNSQDKDGNTALHIAASKNHPRMIKLLIKCKGIDRNMVNGRGLTALKVLQEQTPGDRASLNILRSAEYSRSRCFELSRFSGKLDRDVSEMRIETINALLVVFALILTMTHQAVLSPPRRVWRYGDTDSKGWAKAVDIFFFISFFIPKGIAFSMAWTITLVLLSLVAKSIISFVRPLNLLMCFCYGAAVCAIGPSFWSGLIAAFVPGIFVPFIYGPFLFRFKK